MNHESANLDLLRSVAVLCVLQTHLWHVLRWNSAWLEDWGIISLGSFGVLMFFIHTSLVLMFSLDRLSQASQRGLAVRFYIRRFFRLYPLSIFTVVVVLGLHIPSSVQDPGFIPLPTRVVIANLLLVQNIPNWPSAIGPLWSLPFEVQMYLLLPLLYVVAKRIRSFPGVLALVFAGFVAKALELRVAALLGYSPILLYAPWFFMGISAYVISRFTARTINGRWFYVLMVAFIAVECFIHRFIQSYRGGWVYWADGLLFAMSLPYFADITEPAVRRVCHTIAKYSYGIYLWHVPILWFAFKQLASQPLLLRVAVFSVLIVALPVALYHCVEAPLIRVGASLARPAVEPRPLPAL